MYWRGRESAEGPQGAIKIVGIDTYEQFNTILEALQSLEAPAQIVEAPADEDEPEPLPVSDRAAEEDTAFDPGPPDDMPLAEGDAVEEPPAPPQEAADYSGITKLRDLVTALQAEGCSTFEMISARAMELKDGNLCPLLGRTDRLLDRLMNTCKVMGVATQ